MNKLVSGGLVLGLAFTLGACGGPTNGKGTMGSDGRNSFSTADHEEPSILSGTVCIEGTKRYDPSLGEAGDNELEGVAGILIELYDDEENLLDTTFTDSEGHYQFCGLDEGDYVVVEVLPDATENTIWIPIGDTAKDATVEFDEEFSGTSVKYEGNEINEEFDLDPGEIHELEFDLEDYPGLIRVEVKSATTVVGLDIDCPGSGDSVTGGVDGQGTAEIHIETECETVEITSSKGISYIELFFGEIGENVTVDFRNVCVEPEGDDYRGEPKGALLDMIFAALEGTGIFSHPLIVEVFGGEIEDIVDLRDFLAMDDTDDLVAIAQLVVNLAANLALGELDEDDLVYIPLVMDFFELGYLLDLAVLELADFDEFSSEELGLIRETLEVIWVLQDEPCEPIYPSAG